MDDAKRQQLLARREQHEHQRRAEASREALAPLIAQAERLGIALTLHDPGAAPDWLAGLVPAGLTHLDWTGVEGARVVEAGETWPERAEQIRPWLEALSADAPLFAVTANGANAIAELRVADAVSLIEGIVALDPFELWLSVPSEGELIELRHPWLRARL